MQVAPWQRWPATQGGPPPQVQPLPLQPSASVESQLLQAWFPSTGHWLTVGGLTQVLPLQQPPGHAAASQKQAYCVAPPTKKHCWPAGQGGFEPQAHVDPLEQVSVDRPLLVQSVQAAPLCPQV